jgi:hypothetical protein
MAMLGVQRKEEELQPYQEKNRYFDTAHDADEVIKKAPEK